MRIEDLAELVMIDIYEVYGAGRSAERARYFQALALASFDELFGGTWDGWTLPAEMGDAAARRHLQLYIRDAAEQAAFEQLNLAGGLPACADGEPTYLGGRPHPRPPRRRPRAQDPARVAGELRQPYRRGRAADTRRPDLVWRLRLWRPDQGDP